ncbi:MAG: DUF2911 domain-containing protein, partial [Balneolaceae bacterium]
MKNFIFTLLITSLLAACSEKSDPNNAAFVTLLGNDTLAVEQFQKTDSSITARVILRNPETRFSAYLLNLDETGGIKEMARTDYPYELGFSGDGVVVQTIIRSGDSLEVEITGDEEIRSYKAPYEKGVLPFID